MTYNEWLELLDILKKSSKREYMDKLINEPTNNNIQDALSPKIKDMIYERFRTSIQNIIKNLEMMFEDVDLFDMEMVNFRKNIKLTMELINNNNLYVHDRIQIEKNLKEEVEETYKILEKEAIKSDDDGVLYNIIKNNRIKWSDNNELQGS